MIRVEDLYISYQSREVVSNINFSFGPGQSIGIIGPNGAGKSTMIKGILGLIPIDRGKAYLNDQPIEKVKKKIAYVAQNSDIDWDFPIDVFSTVLMGTYPSLGLFKRPGKREREIAIESLERVNMLKSSHKQIGQLSGGEKQRVFLARALVQNADVYFLDEPFTGIDMASEKRIVKVLRDLKSENKTIFIVNHDLSKVESYFDQLILMNRYLCNQGPVDEIFNYENILKVYGSDLKISVSSDETILEDLNIKKPKSHLLGT